MPTKDYSFKQEHAVADALGWEVVSGSGARPCVPGDVRSSNWLGECKTHTTSGQKIFFDLEVWKKICHEADIKHCAPVLIADDGSQDLKHTWCLCREVAINLSGFAVADLDVAVRKNVIFDDAKQSARLASLYKSSGGAIVFDDICISVRWNDEDVLIMKFDTFLRVHDK